MSMPSFSPPAPDDVPDLAGRATKSGGAMFIAKCLRTALLLVVNIVLINLLLPADFGMVRYVMLIVGLADLLYELGLTTAIVQRQQLRDEDLWSLFLVGTLWGLLLYAIIFLCAPAAARYFTTPQLTPLLRVGALLIPVAGITTVHQAMWRRRMLFGRLAAIEVSAAGIAAICSIGMAFAGFGVWALIAGSLVFEGVTSLLLLLLVRIPRFPLQPFFALRTLLFFGAGVVVVRFIDYLIRSVPLFLIGKSIGPEGLGLFSLANDLATLPQTAFIAVLAMILISTFSRIQNDPVKTSSGFGRLVLFGTILSVPVLLIMCMLPHELLRVICFFKDNNAWLPAAPLLQWLAAMGIIYLFNEFIRWVWIAQGKIFATIVIELCMLVTVVIAVAIGARWGLEGISIALLLRTVVICPVFVYLNYRLTSISVGVFVTASLPSLVAGVFMALTLLAFRTVFFGDTLQGDFLTLLCGSFCGAAIYLLALFIFFRPAMKKMTEMFRGMLPGRRRSTDPAN